MQYVYVTYRYVPKLKICMHGSQLSIQAGVPLHQKKKKAGVPNMMWTSWAFGVALGRASICTAKFALPSLLRF